MHLYQSQVASPVKENKKETKLNEQNPSATSRNSLSVKEKKKKNIPWVTYLAEDKNNGIHHFVINLK